jgi:hypothetical protein
MATRRRAMAKCICLKRKRKRRSAMSLEKTSPVAASQSAQRLAPSLLQVLADAAPSAGLYFYNATMWGILPGVYVKYFGLSRRLADG